MAALAAAAAALAAVLLLVGPGLRRRAVDHNREALLAEARLMARVVEEPLARGELSTLDPFVDQAARDMRTRVTVIAPDGRVLADSALSGPGLAAVENHRDRPEVIEAIAHGTGSSLRHSATVRQDLLYVAVAVRRGARLLGVVRVAAELKDIEEQARELWRSVAVAMLLAFAVTALLAIALSAPLAKPLGDIMESARRFAAGDLAARSRVSRGDELGELAGILNRSAEQLQARITEIAGDRARTGIILSAIDEGLLAVDHRGVVILANASLCRDLGLRDPVGRHYLEVLRHPEVGRVVEEVLRTGERRAVEVRLHHLRRVYAVTGGPFPGLEGSPPGAVLSFHDVTERRRLEQVRRDFVANASHELRTPLTSIRGFVEALEDGALQEPAHAHRFLEKIRIHADRMASLVSDLLELSRLEAGEKAPQWERVDLGEVVEEVIASFANLASGKGVLLVHGGEGEAPTVVTDRDRLRRMVENFVENALKYTPAGGRVEVSARAADAGDGVVEVSDDGPGIPAEHLPRIFERFYRVDKARSRDLGGTGLGLSIVKHLAESVNAAVSVDSAPGRGSRFRVTLPAEPTGR